MSQFYIRKITLTTVKVTIRPDLLRLAIAPSALSHLQADTNEPLVVINVGCVGVLRAKHHEPSSQLPVTCLSRSIFLFKRLIIVGKQFARNMYSSPGTGIMCGRGEGER